MYLHEVKFYLHEDTMYSVGHSPQGSVLNITRLELELQGKGKNIETIEIIENNTNNIILHCR